MERAIVAAVMMTVLGAPSVLLAESSFYASIRQTLLFTEEEVDNGAGIETITDLKVVDNESRIGLQGNQNLGEVTGFGRWEVGIDASVESSSPVTRLGYVGLSGNFGTLSFGTQWSAWDTFVGGEHASFVSEGSWHNGTERNGHTLKYAGQFGGLSLEADAILVGSSVETPEAAAANEGELDELQLGLGYGYGPVIFQLGLIQRDGGATGYKGGGRLLGGRLTYDTGPITLAAAVAQDDESFGGGSEETIGVKLRAEYTKGPNLFRFVVTRSDNKIAGNAPAGVVVGYQYDLSERARVSLEMSSVDLDIAGLDATTEGGVMYRHDW